MKKIIFLLLVLLIVGCQNVEKVSEVQKPPVEPSVEEGVTTVEEVVIEDQPTEPEVVEAPEEVEPEPKSTAEEEPVVVVEPTPEEVPKKTEAEVPPAPISEEESMADGEMSEEIKSILVKADKKVKSYSFTYAPPPGNLARDVWKIKGNKIKVELFDDNYVTPDTYYDTVFIDTTKKTAIGVCVSQRTTRCAEQNQRFDLDYDSIIITTPYQWLKSIKYAEMFGSQMIYDRIVSVVAYETAGKKYKQWIDDFSGLPVKVSIKDGFKETFYDFRYLAVNNVEDADLLPPEKKE